LGRGTAPLIAQGFSCCVLREKKSTRETKKKCEQDGSNQTGVRNVDRIRGSVWGKGGVEPEKWETISKTQGGKEEKIGENRRETTRGIQLTGVEKK